MGLNGVYINLSRKVNILQKINSYYDKNGVKVGELPVEISKFDENENQIINIKIDPVRNNFISFQYTIKEFDCNNNVIYEIVFSNLGKSISDFGLIQNGDGTISISSNLIISRFRIENEYNQKGDLTKLIKSNNSPNLFNPKWKRLVERFKYRNSLLSEVKSEYFLPDGNELFFKKMIEIEYKNRKEISKKIVLISPKSPKENKKEVYKSIYSIDNSGNSVKEQKYYLNNIIKWRKYSSKIKEEVFTELNSYPSFTKLITFKNNEVEKKEIWYNGVQSNIQPNEVIEYKDGLKISSISSGVNYFMDKEVYKVRTDFLYEESNLFSNINLLILLFNNSNDKDKVKKYVYF